MPQESTSAKRANKTASAKPSKASTMNGVRTTENESSAPYVSGEHASGVREISIAPAGRKAAQLRAITLQGKPSFPAPFPPGGNVIPDGSLQRIPERHETASGDLCRAGAQKADRAIWLPSASSNSTGKEIRAVQVLSRHSIKTEISTRFKSASA